MKLNSFLTVYITYLLTNYKSTNFQCISFSFQLRNHVNIIYYYHLLYSSIAYTKLAIWKT